jgi:hypothetical protein
VRAREAAPGGVGFPPLILVMNRGDVADLARVVGQMPPVVRPGADVGAYRGDEQRNNAARDEDQITRHPEPFERPDERGVQELPTALMPIAVSQDVQQSSGKVDRGRRGQPDRLHLEQSAFHRRLHFR